MTTTPQQIRIDTYRYALPDERIARYPLPRRDSSRLLLYRAGEIGESRFSNIAAYLPAGALLVFNNTRVVRARMHFHKESGAAIEIFCLEPAEPRDYAQAFRQTRQCAWTCLVGNLKKWKKDTLRKSVQVNGATVCLQAQRTTAAGPMQNIVFSWDNPDCSFADLLEGAGQLPIPPYLHREAEAADLASYQTVYSCVEGSGAATTAGLHFTPEVLHSLEEHGFEREELTLHVGAGTFRPVAHDTLEKHEMHTEYISVQRSAIERIQKTPARRVVAVGTTSTRTLESLYYIGVILSAHPDATPGQLVVPQWMPYSEENNRLTTRQALQYVLDYLDRRQSERLITATQILIAPGYTFRIVGGILTNFHQPRSTLLLLVAAFVGEDWERIYAYALDNGFRFLSYGDSSLLLP